MSLIRQFAIRNELLYSGFVLLNVQIFFVQKISFATFGVSIDDFFTRYAGLGYSLDSNFVSDFPNRQVCQNAVNHGFEKSIYIFLRIIRVLLKLTVLLETISREMFYFIG